MTECIISPYTKDKDGYAKRTVKGKVAGAHRFAYCEHHSIPIESIDGKVVMHTCDNPPCVNPDHLVLGSIAENNADRSRKGRTAKNLCGQTHRAKITKEQAQEIRDRYEPNHPVNGGRPMAKEFGLSDVSIVLIAQGKNWGKHTKPKSSGGAK